MIALLILTLLGALAYCRIQRRIARLEHEAYLSAKATREACDILGEELFQLRQRMAQIEQAQAAKIWPIDVSPN